MEKLKILYVDDEKPNLINFTVSMQRHFLIFTAASGVEALAVFKDNPDISVVVADQRMPGMTGVELLSRIREQDPDVVRIILTAYTEIKDILDSINRGKIYHYLVKPWDEGELLQLLRKAGETYLLTRENSRLLTELDEKNRLLEADIAKRKRIEAILLRRDMILAAVNDMARSLLLNADWQAHIEGLIGRMGLVLGVNRVHILKHSADEQGELMLEPVFRWINSDGIPAQGLESAPVISYRDKGFDRCQALFARGELLYGNTKDFAEQEVKDYLNRFQIKSIALAPIMMEKSCWGVVTFADCLNEREWPAAELDALKTAASLIGTAILRENAEQSLAAHRAQLTHAGRLTALGEMASGLGHEIYQPLTIINLGAETCKSYFDRHDPHCPEAEASEEMLANVRKVTGIVNSMRSFSRASSGDWKRISLVSPLREAMTFFSEQFRIHMIEYSEAISADLPLVKTDGQKFEQIVVNLLSNARYAVDKKQEKDAGLVKKITVSLRHETITDQEFINLQFKKKETTSDRIIIFEVTDNGIGMSPEVRNRCLEPFFTTKEVGEGTGLGLSVTLGIIRELNFQLDIHSREGEGSTFRVIIPVDVDG
ncbi:MAG: response regulator [Deltaproteobacteria bacterium]|nr:response regulator [Deltaproteobacteria bacterium]